MFIKNEMTFKISLNDILSNNSTCTLNVHQMFIKNEITFKITIRRIIDQIMILIKW
jgi:hypothetical protein